MICVLSVCDRGGTEHRKKQNTLQAGYAADEKVTGTRRFPPDMRPPIVLSISSLLLTACVHTPPPHPRALQNNELCVRYLAQNDLERADVHCDLALEFSPQYADAWTNKGIIAMRRRRIPEAKDDLIKALRYNQEQAQAYHNLGTIYLEEKNYGPARDNFERALKVNPDYAEARYALGLTLLKMGSLDASWKQFLTLVEVYPHFPDAHHGLATVAYQQGRYAVAEQEMRRVVELSPDRADGFHDLGEAQMKLNRFCEGVESFRTCLQRDKGSVECSDALELAQRRCALNATAIGGAGATP